MPATAKEIKTFAQKVDQLQKRALHLTAEQRATIREASRHATENIQAAIRARATLAGQDVQLVSAVADREMTALLQSTRDVIVSGQQTAYEAAVAASRELSLAVSAESVFWAPSVDLLTIASDYTADLVRTIHESLMGRVNGVLGRAAVGGMTPHEAARKIDEILGRTGGQISYQAERIVRTEIQRVYSATLDNSIHHMMAGMDTKVAQMLKKTWVSGPDTPRRRPEHQAMDGQTVRIDDDFVTPWTHVPLRYPRDPNGPAEHVINCGCGWKIATENLADIAAANVNAIAEELGL